MKAVVYKEKEICGFADVVGLQLWVESGCVTFHQNEDGFIEVYEAPKREED